MGVGVAGQDGTRIKNSPTQGSNVQLPAQLDVISTIKDEVLASALLIN